MLAVCDYITAIPKGASYSDRENYRHISITPILSKVYETLVSHKLSSFSEIFSSQLLSLLVGKVWAALITVSHHL